MEFMESQVEKAAIQIKKNRADQLFKFMSTLCDLISDEGMPIAREYTEDTYYKLVVYPDEYLTGLSIIRKLVRDLQNTMEIDNELVSHSVFIGDYITYFMYKRITILEVINIYYPIRNDMYRIKTYFDESRFSNTSIDQIKKSKYQKMFLTGGAKHPTNHPPKKSEKKIKYIHPQYTTEGILADYCSPEYEDKHEIYKSKIEILGIWRKISPEHFSKFGNRKKFLSKTGLKMYEKISKLCYPANYDLLIPICVASEENREEIDAILGENFNLGDVKRNLPKTTVDPRYTNYAYFVDGKQCLKIWYILQFELVPVLHNKKVHIAMLQRLVLSEFITYTILKFDKVAFSKLVIFMNLLKREREMRHKKIYIDIVKCKYVGKSYPVKDYLSEVRLQNIRKYIKRIS